MASAEPRAGRSTRADAARGPSLRDYCIGTLLRPRATFEALSGDRRSLKFALLALLVTTQLYSLTHILLAWTDRGSGARLWVDIPVASYFHYEELFETPSIFAGWLLAAGLAQLLTRVSDGKGSFEGMLSAYGFGISIASLPILLLDLPQSVLGALDLVDLQRLAARASQPGLPHEIIMGLYALSIVWSALLFCIAVRAVQRLRPLSSTLAGLISYLAYAATFACINH